MYEEITYEVILQRMLARIPTGFDTREGSVIYDALAPAAAELAQMYIELDVTRDLGFVGTSSGAYLDKLVGEYGLTRIGATHAVVKGVFNIDVPIGSRYSGDLLNYAVTEAVSGEDHTFLLECETAGTEGNTYTGRLIPIGYVEGLTSAEITEISIPARDEETDEELRKRFFDGINGGAQDGNVAQYEKWCSEFDGIGRYKIFPLYNSTANSVKVSILNENNEKASAALVTAFQNFLDPGGNGLGNGAAPIGAIVTVDTASEKEITAAMTVTLDAGYTDLTKIREAMEDFFRSISYVKSNVNYYSAVAAVMSCEGVEEVTALTLNGATANISLTSEQIPKLTTCTINGNIITL